MDEPRVFVLSEWASRVETKLTSIDDKIEDHDHKQYVTTVSAVKAIAVLVALGTSIAAVLLS